MSKDSVNFYLSQDDGLMTRFLSMNGFDRTHDPLEADMIVFTGGEDVSPFLYGERVLKETYSNFARDRDEIALLRSVPWDIPKVGVCRGGQFLNVMSGGRMFQHVTDHAINGMHIMRETYTDREIPVTSTHHQMMRPSDEAAILAVAKLARQKKSDGINITYKDDVRQREWDDVEACYYGSTNSLCYQPHPEYLVKGNRLNQLFFLELVDTYLLNKTQQEIVAKKRELRFTPDK